MAADSYISVDLIVEGALDEALILPDEESVTSYVDELIGEHKRINAQSPWEVYTLLHSHPLSESSDCGCVQYVTDHHPAYVIGE